MLEMKLGSSLACWVPCRQKSDWPSGRRSAVLAQISQKCFSCTNCLLKCVEHSYMTALLSTNIVDNLPVFCKDGIANFCYVFRCCVCRRSSRRLIVVDRRSSVLEAYVPSGQQKSSGLKFSKSRTGSHVTYSCHHNSSRFSFPIFVHSWRFSVFHSLQTIMLRIY
jgi:hypothetical protein